MREAVREAGRYARRKADMDARRDAVIMLAKKVYNILGIFHRLVDLLLHYHQPCLRLLIRQ